MSFGPANQSLLGQSLWPGLYIEELGMHPMVDIVLERDDAAGESENDEKYPRRETEPEMECEQNPTCRHRVSAVARSFIATIHA